MTRSLALRHQIHVRLAVRASYHIDTPWLTQRTAKNRDIDLQTSTNIHYPQRTPCCTSTTWLTSTTRNNSQAAPIYDPTNVSYPHRTSSCTYLRLDHTSYRHQLTSWRHNYRVLYIRICESDNELSPTLHLLPRCCFLHCLWLLLLARLT